MICTNEFSSNKQQQTLTSFMVVLRVTVLGRISSTLDRRVPRSRSFICKCSLGLRGRAAEERVRIDRPNQ